MYSATLGPGTLLMATLASGGMALASLLRPHRLARPPSNHGAPNDGKSVGRAVLTLLVTALADMLAALMACRRSSGSLMWLARLMRIMDAWVFMSVLPASRRLTGTAANSGLAGLQFRSARYLRKAPEQMAITTSFSVAPLPLAMCFNSAIGKEKLLKLRWLVTLTLIGVLGANKPAFSVASTPVPPAALSSATGLSMPQAARANEGRLRASLTVCVRAFLTPEPANSAMPKLSLPAGLREAGRTARGTALMSMMACASATPASPSTAAWCTLE